MCSAPVPAAPAGVACAVAAPLAAAAPGGPALAIAGLFAFMIKG